ncbi:MAG: amidohydrolase [Deltaproteobacteria bacterium]|nr:amidohydrolase [Deltaproteobacteria bacterium]
MKSLVVIDADGHVEEHEQTFSDKYLDPAFRAQRPQVVGLDGLAYWMIEEQLFPRRLGRGCHNLGTPTSYGGKRTLFTQSKPESLESLELRDPAARLRDMDAEDLGVAVLYPTLFLAYPLTVSPPLGTALCVAYNRWMAEMTAGSDRLRWAAVVNLDEVPAAARQVREARTLGAVAVMVLGTGGDRLLDDPAFLPFFEAVAQEDLTLAVHVGWACPPLSNLYTDLYTSTVIPFLAPVLMGFASLVGGGLLDRFPALRVAFLEAGCEWVHFMVHRLEHRFHFATSMAKIIPQTAPRAACLPQEYLRRGHLYVSTEVEDALLPQVIELVGEDQIIFGSDMPHGDRERFAARTLQARADLSESAKRKILEENPRRLYRL